MKNKRNANFHATNDAAAAAANLLKNPHMMADTYKYTSMIGHSRTYLVVVMRYVRL